MLAIPPHQWFTNQTENKTGEEPTGLSDTMEHIIQQQQNAHIFIRDKKQFKKWGKKQVGWYPENILRLASGLRTHVHMHLHPKPRSTPSVSWVDKRKTVLICRMISNIFSHSFLLANCKWIQWWTVYQYNAIYRWEAHWDWHPAQDCKAGSAEPGLRQSSVSEGAVHPHCRTSPPRWVKMLGPLGTLLMTES